MDIFLIGLIVMIILIIFWAWDSESHRLKEREVNNSDSAVKHYALHVTPDIRTRLGVLKMRGETFSTEIEGDNLDYESHEAILLAEPKSWKELSLNLPEIAPADIWTDIGTMSKKKVEAYYQFLERFREIIENDSLGPEDKIRRVRKMTDPGRFKAQLRKKYGSDFPINMFIEPLVEIDGVSEAIAVQLFKKKIYGKADLKKMSKKRLLSLNGVGEARAERIHGSLSKN